ncbi:OmpH family outer membrane protein [Haloferula sp. BvORR071]|uniref:OmpH family outer membrane protein n=1 Tax=Haloferula sp. BvORR071 TaxID=1396141 RepID=UPI0005570AE6|nr:OmpH family outer membrane protein [Haloferula sp. BvORR071]
MAHVFIARPLRVLAATAATFSLSACQAKKEATVTATPPQIPSPPPTAAPSTSTPLPPFASPTLKIATVDMKQVFREYHRTIAADKDQRAAIVKVNQENQERLESIRKLQQQVEELGKAITDPAISDSKRQTLAKERQAKFEEGVALDKERQTFLQHREQALREKTMERRGALFEDIRRVVVDTGKAEACDYVFDKSAIDSLQLPFFLLTPDSADLTGEILAQLNRDAPTPEEESSARTEPDIPLGK